MRGSAHASVLAVAFACATIGPTVGQAYAQVWEVGGGLAALNTDVNALGAGVQVRWRFRPIGPLQFSLRGVLDAERPAEELGRRYEKELDPSGGFFYIRDKVTGARVNPAARGVLVRPPMRIYYGAYVVARVRRFLAGAGVAKNPVKNAGSPSVLVGVELTRRSQVVLEFPDFEPWRLRLEFTVVTF